MWCLRLGGLVLITLFQNARSNETTTLAPSPWITTQYHAIYFERNDSEPYDPPYYGQRPRCMLCAHRIVPYVLNRPPPRVLEAYYEGNVRAHYGNNLTTKEASKKPRLDWDIVLPDMYYCSMMIGPDIPTFENSSLRYYLHSLTINILGKDKDKTGEDLVEYVGPAPHEGTGEHRYLWLVFKQPGKLNIKEPRINKDSTKGRAQYKWWLFMRQHNLSKPEAATFFFSQHDQHVKAHHDRILKLENDPIFS